MQRYVRSIVIGALLLAAVGRSFAGTAEAQDAEDTAFARTWERLDRPVADGQVSRTWMWGPALPSGAFAEPYGEAPGGERQVQYYEKSRMELTQPSGDPLSIWYVTNGLLVTELVSGLIQTGDHAFDDLGLPPAPVSIAGDPGERPTYADIDRLNLRAQAPTPVGAPITLAYTDDNVIANDPAYASAGVTAAEYVDATQHTVAAPFWAFMGSAGLVWQDGAYTTTQLFPNPYYATGYPITEAYWSQIAIGGLMRAVLWQCFERRCLTYAPGNPPGWQVESGNVGQHYFNWRYGSYGAPPSSLAPEAFADDDTLQVFAEQTAVTLSSELVVDFTAAGQYDELSDLPNPVPTISAGATVNSYFVHADQHGVDQPVAFYATLTFPEEILGVMVLDGTLVAGSSILGVPTTTYPADEYIGLEFSATPTASTQDAVTLTASRHSLVIRTTVYDVVDQLRVITAASAAPCVSSGHAGVTSSIGGERRRAGAAQRVAMAGAWLMGRGHAPEVVPAHVTARRIAEQLGSGACPAMDDPLLSRPLRLAG